MAVNLTQVLNEILYDKEANMKPEDIRYGSIMLGIRGTLRPVTIEGGDTSALIYAQTDTPITHNGLWLNTDKAFDQIYIEPERYTNKYSWIVSDDTTDSSADTTNMLKGVVAPANLEGSTYVQRGNVVHFFGRRAWGLAEGSEPVASSHQHYMYNFDTNTWTKLVDTPTPQGLSGAVWIGDYIYILGSVYNTYYNYCYKYDTINDTYERLPDLVSGANDNHPSWAVYGDAPYIYGVRGKELYKYNTEDYTSVIMYTHNSYGFTTCALSSSTNYTYERGGFDFADGKLYMSDVSSVAGFLDYDLHIYNTATNSLSTKTLSGNPYQVRHIDYPYVYLNGRTTYSNGGVFPNQSRVLDLIKNTYTTCSSTNSYSTDTFVRNQPICIFTAKPYNILCVIGRTNRTTGMTLNSKEYTFDKNTLIMYAIQNGSSKYKAKLFEYDKIINDSKLYTGFDNVDLFEKGETENTLIKNIPTYYGNGSDWIQIK